MARPVLIFGPNGAKNLQDGKYDGVQFTVPKALTDGANIAVDASLSNVFTVTLAGNRELDNPTNLVNGQTFVFRFTQDATGTRLLTYGSAYRFPGGTTPALSTGANAVDYLTGVSDGTNVDLVIQANFS